MPVIKLRHKAKPFEAISRHAIENIVSSDAIALFVVMAMCPESWVFHKRWIKERLGWGEHKYRAAMGELTDAGYISYVQTTDGDTGRFNGTEIWFSQETTEASVFRASEKPLSGKSTPLEKTESLEKTEKENIYPPFDDFWSLYPRKEGRKLAVRKWDRMTQKERESALAHLRSAPYADRDRQFIPHASTYLNQERWAEAEDPASPTTIIGI